MSKVHSIEGCVDFTRSGQTTFSGIGAIIPGESRLLGVRPGIGFCKLVGLCKVVSAAPGAAPGVLSIEQSVDGTNWDLVQSYNLLPASATQAVSAEVVGLYIRARFTVQGGENYTIRFGGFLDPMGGGGSGGGGGGGGGCVIGDVIDSAADTTVGVGLTVALTVPPAGTLRMRVQVTGGDATSIIRIRELGGTAGTGVILTLLGSTLYGGGGGAIAALEAQNVTGPSATVAVQFEGE